jgi:hypothetical protein
MIRNFFIAVWSPGALGWFATEHAVWAQTVYSRE